MGFNVAMNDQMLLYRLYHIDTGSHYTLSFFRINWTNMKVIVKGYGITGKYQAGCIYMNSATVCDLRHGANTVPIDGERSDTLDHINILE